AQGVVIAPPPRCDPACPGPEPLGDQIDIRSLRADVTIHDQIAETRIDQVVRNPNQWTAEARLIFPLPAGAAVSGYTLWIDGEPVEATLLDAGEARRVYDDIVRSLRDPGLLAYRGDGAVQASVFPIPPGGERQIRFEYSQILPNEGGVTHYVAPLGVVRFSAQPVEHVSVRVAIDATTPLRAIYSPSHDVAIDRNDDRHAVVGFESAGAASPADFDLFYSASPDPIGASVVSYVDPATGDGTFMLLAAPGIDPGRTAMAKDVILVLDTSGSMKGEKLAQAKTALDAVLADLAPDDRFAAIEFSTGAREFAASLTPAGRASEARAWVDGLRAEGGTDIDLALQTALSMVDPDRPTMLLFLTDGLPTEGVVDANAILRDVASVAPASVRLFAFGVGDDVDTTLLD
ncbi:MAG TPA: VIT domain-containing protein, partial [Thermomicrobiales bacterium]|nr:VIT domain-containing protein [Thermomicrobiales bacterium]